MYNRDESGCFEVGSGRFTEVASGVSVSDAMAAGWSSQEQKGAIKETPGEYSGY